MEKHFFGMEKASGIYKITNLVNGKIYIGQTKKFGIRAAVHANNLKRNKHTNKHLQAAWNQYGSDAFEFSVLMVIDCPEKRTVVEQRCIDMFYGENCYNLEKKVQLLSEDVLRKMSASHLGRTHSEETKQKIRESKLGIPRPEAVRQKVREANLGKTLSEEHKEALHASRRGVRHTEESIQKMREATRGRERSEATRQKMREANLGKTLSEETKQKMRESRRRYLDSKKESEQC